MPTWPADTTHRRHRRTSCAIELKAIPGCSAA
jgi:hypothetical protein